MRLQEELKKLGLHEVHSEGALFTYVVEGKLHGIIVSHVDDLLVVGDEKFKKEVEEKLASIFKFSKMEKDDFNYCGCRIRRKENGNIEIDQHEYIKAIENITEIDGNMDQKLSTRSKD